MRVCPECGYTQEPYWLYSRYCVNMDWCYYNDFKNLKPDLALKLETNREVKDKTFIYRRGGKNGVAVERMDIEFHHLHGWRPKYEAAHKIYQGELLEEYF